MGCRYLLLIRLLACARLLHHHPQNWHLLPYAQLLELLDWDVARMNFTLKEDDFLWHKLGDLKPATEPVYYVADNAQQRQTAALRKVVALFPQYGG